MLETIGGIILILAIAGYYILERYFEHKENMAVLKGSEKDKKDE